jgi:hypothetical protein
VTDASFGLAASCLIWLRDSPNALVHGPVRILQRLEKEKAVWAHGLFLRVGIQVAFSDFAAVSLWAVDMWTPKV